MSLYITLPAKTNDEIEILDMNFKELKKGKFQKYEDTENGVIYTFEDEVYFNSENHLVRVNSEKVYKVSRNLIWTNIQ